MFFVVVVVVVLLLVFRVVFIVVVVLFCNGRGKVGLCFVLGKKNVLNLVFYPFIYIYFGVLEISFVVQLFSR